MKHTEGKWEIKVWDYPNAKSPRKELIIQNSKFRIAVLDHDEMGDNPYTIPKAEAEANARLIAAAPDLLEAMKALFEHCSMVHRHWGDGCNQKQADAAKKAGRDAIAKAEREL